MFTYVPSALTGRHRSGSGSWQRCLNWCAVILSFADASDGRQNGARRVDWLIRAGKPRQGSFSIYNVRSLIGSCLVNLLASRLIPPGPSTPNLFLYWIVFRFKLHHDGASWHAPFRFRINVFACASVISSMLSGTESFSDAPWNTLGTLLCRTTRSQAYITWWK